MNYELRVMNYFRTTIKTLILLFLLLTSVQLSIQAQDIQGQAIKFGRVLKLVESFYVDTVNINKLTESAITEMLASLDPHSIYISKNEMAEMNQPLEGNFEGIGISFNIFQDTLIVMTTIPGGPSEQVGLKPGDRIVKVDTKNIANTGLKTPDVFKLLRGDKGTKVYLSVIRKGEHSPLEFTIIRDKIPIFSLDASFMLNKETAYIKLNKFAATTIDEYKEAMKSLNANAMVKNLVLDLRGNGGGFLGAAYELVNQFLDEKKLIVYTEGVHSPRRDYYSTTRGDFVNGNLVILIDEGSASASEIVSGAIQDWDRGVLIGRRSFGKGLVQQQIPLNDGSMIRLTTAHYYTPAGRNIQKPYKEDIKDYRNDYIKRYEKGEMFSKDSISFPDSLMIRTLVTKRKVYGGGGIMPDIFMPMDTSRYYRYFNNLVRKNVLFPFVVGFIDKNRDQLKAQYKTVADFKNNFLVTDTIMEGLIKAGEKEGIKRDEESLKVSGAIIARQIRALLARDLYDAGAYYQIMIEDDKEVGKALEILSDQKTFNQYLNKVEDDKGHSPKPFSRRKNRL
jgi:carboxyl-terminal processing protease